MPTLPLRTLRQLAAALCTFTLAAAPAGAQLGVSAACAPGAVACDALRVTFSLDAASAAPVAFGTLRLSLGGDWRFAAGPSALLAGEDAFDFVVLGAVVEDGGAPALTGPTLFADLLGQGASFELLPGMTGWLEASVVAGTAPLALDVTGTDITGAPLGGAPSVAPEPSTVLLLAGGLGALALTRARRRRIAPAQAVATPAAA